MSRVISVNNEKGVKRLVWIFSIHTNFLQRQNEELLNHKYSILSTRRKKSNAKIKRKDRKSNSYYVSIHMKKNF
jgi:hypothetical protein